MCNEKGARDAGYAGSLTPTHKSSLRATSAALFAVTAVIFTKFLFDVEWLEAALDMVVTNYVMWTTNDATRTSGAKAGGNHFFVKLFPLERPPFRFRSFSAGFCQSHT